MFLFQKFALFELGLDEILRGNLGENGRSVQQNLKMSRKHMTIVPYSLFLCCQDPFMRNL